MLTPLCSRSKNCSSAAVIGLSSTSALSWKYAKTSPLSVFVPDFVTAVITALEAFWNSAL